MPELPEVESLRRQLAPYVRGAEIDRVVIRRSGLRRPFPADLAARLTGATVRQLTRRAKYLLAELASDDTLVVHLGMSGWFRIEPAEHPERPHDHVVLLLSNGRAVVFNDPRRFGVIDLVASGEAGRYGPLASLSPEPLSAAFDAAWLARACARSRRAIKVALLDQRVVAGLGNIYASEALHVARLSPRLAASALATRTGRPRPAAHRLAAAVKTVLTRAIDRQRRKARAPRFRVYDREGERCLRPRCTGTIRRVTQAGRSTFYCPVCQRR
ncbi:MAG TPA: bifunctional DNA-formamidopyrimidine glycosylase/DNA-(apurinic or apyrimidinic site) lyase [Vicinamibacterales bacterium]|nr:bifunctional DNA-formamidopyrimidine glycosylase/DNA-(apurinic or apyrimidinic site) lyase [Vicinamibacterales bacterium]